MKTAVTDLPDSRARIEVEVESPEVERGIERAAAEIGRELKIPGFRKGKVPAQVVLQRVGRGAVVEQALRDSLPEWYERALLDSGVSPIGEPKLDVATLPESAGESLQFSIEVSVRPPAQLGEYRGLEVGKAEPEVPEEAISEQLDRLREGFASLNPVERPAADGDHLLIDYVGTVDGEPFEGGEGRDELVELGSGRLLDDLEQGLRGAGAGEERAIDVDFPADYPAEQLGGKTAAFAVTVKEVREKELPQLDDDFAADASEFDTLAELRADIEAKLREALGRRADELFRTAAVDAAVDASQIELPDEVVTARAGEMVDRFLRQLEGRGISREDFTRVQEGGEERLLADARPDAERALKREAVMTAIADAEGIEVSEEEMLAALDPGPGHEDHGHDPPEKVLAQLRESGRDAVLIEDLRLRKAVDLVAESAKPIPMAQAEARERLWTPEKGEQQRDESTEGEEPSDKPGELWTPGR